MDVFPMGLVLGCLFEKEGSVNMTMLPDDDDQIRTTLTEPELLLDRISCNSLRSCREHIRSLCRLEPACRGRLSDVSAALEGLTRSRLQSLNDVRVIDDMQMQVTQVSTVAAKLQHTVVDLVDDVRESHDELKSIISNLSRPTVGCIGLNQSIVKVDFRGHQMLRESQHMLAVMDSMWKFIPHHGSVGPEGSHFACHQSSIWSQSNDIMNIFGIANIGGIGGSARPRLARKFFRARPLSWRTSI
jgi:hypothetical protein